MPFSGDEGVTLAGGRTKFVTEVSVDNEGNCVWSGPATFKANCELDIGQWPFDKQTCELGFGSFTYGVDRMEIKLFQDKGGGQFTSKFIQHLEDVPRAPRENCEALVIDTRIKPDLDRQS